MQETPRSRKGRPRESAVVKMRGDGVEWKGRAEIVVLCSIVLV